MTEDTKDRPQEWIQTWIQTQGMQVIKILATQEWEVQVLEWAEDTNEPQTSPTIEVLIDNSRWPSTDRILYAKDIKLTDFILDFQIFRKFG